MSTPADDKETDIAAIQRTYERQIQDLERQLANAHRQNKVIYQNLKRAEAAHKALLKEVNRHGETPEKAAGPSPEGGPESGG